MISWGRSFIPQEPKGDSAAYFNGQIWILRRLLRAPVLSGWLLPNEEAGVSSICLPSTPDPK